MSRTGILLLVASAACVRAPAPRHSDAMERSARILQRLDTLEAELNQGTAETATYAELVERHAHAEQIACKVTDEHVEDIRRLAMVQEARMNGQSIRRLKQKAVALARRHPPRRAVASN